MGRLLAIDYGRKRTGIAVTDTAQIIASPHSTIPSHTLYDFLKSYLTTEPVEAFVLGMPVNLDGSDTDTTHQARVVARKLAELFPKLPVHQVDERYTTTLALDAMIRGGSSKKQRREKGALDKISATLLLQSYMEKRSNSF